MALELKYASDATVLLDDLVNSLGTPDSPAGVAMGVAFLLPGSFVERMAQLVGLGSVHPSWRPQGLVWRLIPLLGAMVEEGHTQRLQSACVDARARQALAGEVADRFDQYLYFRPEMIAA